MDLLDIAITKQLVGGGGGSGTDNYNDLSNLPKINDVTLSGSKSSSALGLQSEITSENKLDSDLIDDTNQDNKFVTSTEKNTWNAKQNAIDSEHKLSSSLVSFTTAEAAALASGIDSTKVAQISTNQSNILYGLNTGVKNKLPCQISNIHQPSDTGLKCIYNEDGTYTITGTKSTSDAYLDIENIYADKLNGDHVAYISVTGTGTFNIAAYGWNGTGYTMILSTSASRDFNIGNYTHALFRIRFMGSVGASYNATVKVMVCTMDAWNQSHDWQPPALPNYDLTRLEAEDRASLAEVVDNGAKNLLRGRSNSSAAGTATVQTDSCVVKLTGSAQPGSITFTEPCTIVNSGVYKLKLDLSGTFSSIGLWDLDGNVSVIDTTSSGTYNVSLISGHRYQLFHYTGSSKTLNATIKFMLCKPEEYQISSDIVPYRYQTKNVFCEYKRIASSTSLNSSGISYTAESNGVYRFTALAENSNSVPQELAIYHRQSSSGSAYLLTETTQPSGNNNSLVISGIVLCQTGGIISLSSRYAASATNTHGLLVEKVFDMEYIYE